MQGDNQLGIVHIASGDLWAGAENMIYQLARHQSSNQLIDVSAILLNEGQLARELRRAGIHTQIIPESIHSFVFIIWKIWQTLRRSRPQVIHTHRLKENIIGGVATIFLRSVSSVRTVHGGPERSSASFRLRFLEVVDQLVARYVQVGSVFVSRELQRRMNRYYARCRTEVIPNGVDVKQLCRRSQERLRTGESRKEFRTCFAARLTQVKRVDIYLETARLLIENGPEYMHFYIIGDGPQYSYCERKISEQDLSGRVHLLGFQKSIATLLASMDCLLITSDHEGMPMILIESMILGAVIVSRSVGAIPEALDYGRLGVLVDSDQPPVFANELLNLCSNPKRLSKLRIVGQSHAREVFDIGNTALLYYNFYTSLSESPAIR